MSHSKTTGIQQVVQSLPAMQKPSGWQTWITGAVVFLLGDHIGVWDIDGWFATGQVSGTDLVAVITALGATLSAFGRGRRQS